MREKSQSFNRLISSSGKNRLPLMSMLVIGFLAVTSIALSQRLLKSIGTPGRSQAASSETMDSSFEKSKTGKVMIDVTLNVPFEPEGTLAKEQIQAQHDAIKTSRDALLKVLPLGSYKVISSYENIPHLVLEIDRNAFTVLKQSPQQVLKITDYDAVPEPELFLAQSVPFIGTQTAYDSGDDASSEVIGIIDSGVEIDHPALRDKVIDGACFTTPNQSNLPGNDCGGQAESYGVDAGSACDPEISGSM